MDLPRMGQEYTYLSLANQPSGEDVVEASTNGRDWQPITVTNATAEVLLRGPDFTDNQLGLLVPVNGTKLWIRIVSDPEEIPRIAAVVFLY